MRKIIYYVATSLDGFISGTSGDIDGFVLGGEGVDQYLEDLQAFDTVIMGKNTYEFGYQYGLKPGSLEIRDIVQDSYGTYWIASNSGLFKWDRKMKVLSPYPFKSDNPYGIGRGIIFNLYSLIFNSSKM